LQVGCRAGGPLRWQPLAVEGLPLGLAALKPAEDGGGLVLRLYEPQGARGNVRLALPGGWRVSDGVNLVGGRGGDPGLAVGPFQVRTYRLVRSSRQARP